MTQNQLVLLSTKMYFILDFACVLSNCFRLDWVLPSALPLFLV